MDGNHPSCSKFCLFADIQFQLVKRPASDIQVEMKIFGTYEDVDLFNFLCILHSDNQNHTFKSDNYGWIEMVLTFPTSIKVKQQESFGMI